MLSILTHNSLEVPEMQQDNIFVTRSSNMALAVTAKASMITFQQVEPPLKPQIIAELVVQVSIVNVWSTPTG